MKVLLLHPEDLPFAGVWTRHSWDLILDLGWGGTDCYERWSERGRSPVRSLRQYARPVEDCAQLREIFSEASGILLDAMGLDWWDLLAPEEYERVLLLLLLGRLRDEVGDGAEFCASRPHALVNLLANLLGRAIPVLEAGRSGAGERVRRRVQALRTLKWNTLAEVAFDKFDSDYRLRRWVARVPSASARGPVLLPSAYGNVSRVQAAYARLLPEQEFLLVSTRRSGKLHSPPPNVRQCSLAAFARAAARGRRQELRELNSKWVRLRRSCESKQGIGPVLRAGIFDGLPRWFAPGLGFRDTWDRVLDQQRIGAVLCADENNTWTRLPVLLARRRNLPTVFCAHGALDITLLLRGPVSDTYLVKGEMEHDFVTRTCRVPQERVLTGAPVATAPVTTSSAEVSTAENIVFFSEQYELYAGRTEQLYREVLPVLCGLAREHGKRVVVKLHPFESLRARSELVRSIVSASDYKELSVTAEPMSQEFLRRAWCALTVESSVAVECALAGVPSFLCHWFDPRLCGYGAQYARFGAVHLLRAPANLRQIPELLQPARERVAVRRLLQPMDVERLQQAFAGPHAHPEVRGRSA
jgi:hypothetical protein